LKATLPTADETTTTATVVNGVNKENGHRDISLRENNQHRVQIAV